MVKTKTVSIYFSTTSTVNPPQIVGNQWKWSNIDFGSIYGTKKVDFANVRYKFLSGATLASTIPADNYCLRCSLPSLNANDSNGLALGYVTPMQDPTQSVGSTFNCFLEGNTLQGGTGGPTVMLPPYRSDLTVWLTSAADVYLATTVPFQLWLYFDSDAE